MAAVEGRNRLKVNQSNSIPTPAGGVSEGCHCTALHCTALHCTALHCTVVRTFPSHLHKQWVLRAAGCCPPSRCHMNAASQTPRLRRVNSCLTHNVRCLLVMCRGKTPRHVRPVTAACTLGEARERRFWACVARPCRCCRRRVRCSRSRRRWYTARPVRSTACCYEACGWWLLSSSSSNNSSSSSQGTPNNQPTCHNRHDKA